MKIYFTEFRFVELQRVCREINNNDFADDENEVVSNYLFSQHHNFVFANFNGIKHRRLPSHQETTRLTGRNSIFGKFSSALSISINDTNLREIGSVRFKPLKAAFMKFIAGKNAFQPIIRLQFSV